MKEYSIEHDVPKSLASYAVTFTATLMALYALYKLAEPYLLQ